MCRTHEAIKWRQAPPAFLDSWNKLAEIHGNCLANIAKKECSKNTPPSLEFLWFYEVGNLFHISTLFVPFASLEQSAYIYWKGNEINYP